MPEGSTGCHGNTQTGCPADQRGVRREAGPGHRGRPVVGGGAGV